MQSAIDIKTGINKLNKRRALILIISAVLVFILFILSMGIGSTWINPIEVFKGLFNQSDDVTNAIVHGVRIPRAVAALICGAALGSVGVIMQTNLNNPMASPSTLGVSNAAVLGANLGILILSSGASTQRFSNPYVVILFAFTFAVVATLLILTLSGFKNFAPSSVILVGIALSTFFTAITTLIQFFATDVQLSAMMHWSFGDLGRTTNTDNLILTVIVAVSFLIFMILAPRYNALNAGDDLAKSVGVNTNLLRFASLLLASFVIAGTISYFGIIGFVGIMAPHIMRRIIGNDHRFLIPASALFGIIILQISDIIAKSAFAGIALPVGAITAILGAPFFLYLVFSKDGGLRR